MTHMSQKWSFDGFSVIVVSRPDVPGTPQFTRVISTGRAEGFLPLFTFMSNDEFASRLQDHVRWVYTIAHQAAN